MPKPYERLPSDTDKSFAAFQLFRDLPPEVRSIDEIAKMTGKSKSLIQQWSAKHRWQSRARAWDATLDRRKREADLKALEKMRERQLNLALSMQNVGGIEIRKLLKQADKESASVITVADLLKFIEQGTKLERLTRGEPGEIVQAKADSSDLDYTRLTNEELRQLRRLRSKLVQPDSTEGQPDSVDDQ